MTPSGSLPKYPPVGYMYSFWTAYWERPGITSKSAVQDQQYSVPFAGPGGIVGQQTDVSRGTFSEVSSVESPCLWPQTDEKDAPAS